MQDLLVDAFDRALGSATVEESLVCRVDSCACNAIHTSCWISIILKYVYLVFHPVRQPSVHSSLLLHQQLLLKLVPLLHVLNLQMHMEE